VNYMGGVDFVEWESCFVRETERDFLIDKMDGLRYL
jgi:hypothetical protein